MVSFPLIAELPEGAIRTRWVASTRKIIPQVEEAIDKTWHEKLRTPGIKLWDGAMCRMESWTLGEGLLELEISPTSYRVLFGLNMHNPQLLDQFGREIGADCIGISSAVESSDGYLIFGRRNSSVAYYPNRIHPFAGTLEPQEADDPSQAVRRELLEELHFTDADIAEIRFIGIAEDNSLRQPELIFRVRSKLSRERIEKQVQEEEHHDSWALGGDESLSPEQVRRTFTPVAVATHLLWQRLRFGQSCFDAACERLGV